MITLYRKNRIGIGSWRIWADGSTIYIAHASTDGGAEIVHTEIVEAGLAGRTMYEQVMSRINSRVKRQKDRGYVTSIEDAMNRPLTNQLDQPLPMLAKKLDQMSEWAGKYVMQPKLDGFRCLVSRQGDEVIAYTRGGIQLTNIDHIVDAVKDRLPDGLVLDGELYQHGVPLQKIASLAKRRQPGTENLVYHVYDSFSSDPFEARYEIAQDVVNTAATGSLVMVPNHYVATKDDMWTFFQQFREERYEGGILRDLRRGYESGTRSSGLIKVKARMDAEYKVIDVIPGSDGLGILICQMNGGRTFKTLAPGDHDQKRFILVHKEQYIGRLVTVEFANYTDDGIPFHAVATRFKENI